MEPSCAQPVDSPPWMDIAWFEYLLWRENNWTINDPQGQKRAQNYIHITSNYFKPFQAGWCGCFVDWVLKKTNQIYGTTFSTVMNNPSGSQNYATRKRYPGSIRIRPRLNQIPYGSLVVLQSGLWQGHVGFLVNLYKEYTSLESRELEELPRFVVMIWQPFMLLRSASLCLFRITLCMQRYDFVSYKTKVS